MKTLTVLCNMKEQAFAGGLYAVVTTQGAADSRRLEEPLGLGPGQPLQMAEDPRVGAAEKSPCAGE